MDDRLGLTGIASSGSKSLLEILGHLHFLSQHVASGTWQQVLDTAVGLPVRCLGLDKTALLLPSDPAGTLSLAASKNLSPEFREHLPGPPTDAVVGWIINKASPRVVEDISALPSECAAPYLAEGVRSIICVPIESPGLQPGAFLCMATSPAKFTVWEAEVIYTIANQVAAALSLRSSARDAALTSRDLILQRLREISSSTTDLQELLSQALGEVLGAVQGDSGSILLDKEGILLIAASEGLPEGIPASVRIKRGTGIAGWVAANQKPLLLQGAVENEQFAPLAPRPEVASAISVPLRGRRGTVGVMNVNSTRPDRVFKTKELALVSSAADQITMAVENSSLYEAVRTNTRYLGRLYKIARTITSTLELEKVFSMVVERLRTSLSSEVCALFLYDRETQRVTLAEGYSVCDCTDSQYVDLALPMIKAALHTSRPSIISALTSDPAYKDMPLVRELELHSAAAAALTIKRRTVGFVAAFRQQPGAFPRPLVRFLLGLAELAAIAIENARLYEHQSDIARLTQAELAPHRLETVPGFDFGCKYAPAHQVGGDYYDLIKLDKRRFGLVMADVSGKSVRAATHIAMCKHSVRALAEETHSPSALLQKINRLTYEQTEPEAFISMLYAILDTKRCSAVLSSAGHEPALLFRARSGKTEEITTEGLLLGILPAVTFGERKTYINPGDILMLYTDGLVEALSDLDLLKDALLNGSLKPAQELADNIHRLAVSRISRKPDDIALILLKRL